MLRRKHIRAPRTFDPGPRHPTEHLAYMSRAEMEMLRRLTDGDIDPGPRGIPSFADDSASAKGVERPDSSTKTNYNSGGSSSTSGGSTRSGAAGMNSGSRTPSTSNNSGSKTPSTSNNGGSTRSGASGMASGSKSPSTSNGGGAPKSLSGIGSPSTSSGGAKSPATSSGGGAPRSLSGIGSPTSAPATRSGASGMAAGAPPASSGGPPRSLGGIGSPSGFGAPTKGEKSKERTASAVVTSSNAAQVPGFSTSFEDPRNSLNALRDVMRTQTGFGPNPFADNIDKTVQHLSGEVGPTGVGAGQVAQVMNNRALVNNYAGPFGLARFDNDLTDPQQWASIGTPNFNMAGPGSRTSQRVADQAIKELMDGVAAPMATDFRAVNQKGGFTTAKTGVDVAGNRFGNFEGVSGGQVADLKSALGTQGMWGSSPGAGASSGPVSLPAGALSPDPNYGGMGTGRATEARPGVINASYSPTSPPTQTYGGVSMPNSYSHRFEDGYEVPTPNQFDGTIADPRTVYGYNNAGVPYASLDQNSRGETFDPNQLTPTQQRVYQAAIDYAASSGTPISFFSGADPRGANHQYGHAFDMRVNDPQTGDPVGGLYNPIGQDFPRQDDYKQFAQGVFDNLYQNPDAYGNVGPQARFGGNFRTGDTAYDWMHFDTTPDSSWSQAQNDFHTAARNRAGDTGYQVASADQANREFLGNVKNALTGGIDWKGPVARGLAAAKQYQDTAGGFGFQRAIADKIVASEVKKAIQGGLAAGRDFVDTYKRNGNSIYAPGESPGGAPGYTGAGPTGGQPRAPEKAETKASRSEKTREGGGERKDPKRKTVMRDRRKPASGVSPAKDEGVTETPVILTEAQKDAALRALLGEEWFA